MEVIYMWSFSRLFHSQRLACTDKHSCGQDYSSLGNESRWRFMTGNSFTAEKRQILKMSTLSFKSFKKFLKKLTSGSEEPAFPLQLSFHFVRDFL